MTHSITDILFPFAIALLAVTFIDVFGSITSRKWKYNYGYLTLASLLVYTAIGYHLAPKLSLVWALIVGGLVGIYDSTIGWKLAVLLNANMGSRKEAALKSPTSSRVLLMIVISTFFGSIGALLALY